MPVGGSAERPAAMVVDHDVRGQIAIDSPQAVRHPGAHAREAHQDHAGVPFIMREHVVIRFAGRRVDERQVVDDGRHVGEHFRYPGPGLPILFELERALHQRSRIALPCDDLAIARDAGDTAA